MPAHVFLDIPSTKNLWDKAFKYTACVDSSRLIDNSSLKVTVKLQLDLVGYTWSNKFKKYKQ